MNRRSVASLALALAVVVGGTGIAAPAEAASKKKPPKLAVLVSNDDGYAFEGIDVLVEALRTVPRVKITVVAPATNQTGKGGSTTDGPLDATTGATASGYPATAVDGTPADSVNYALDSVAATPPDVVISGINHGQNLGTVTDLSGTVGAARAAAVRGVPALAVSAALVNPDYPAAAKLAVRWLQEHRAELARKPKGAVRLQSMNVPTCATGRHRGVVEPAVATTADNALAEADCTSTVTKPATDIEAFNVGYVSLTRPSLTPAT